jgi:formamidopyrimidine-DNA glycosylase
VSEVLRVPRVTERQAGHHLLMFVIVARVVHFLRKNLVGKTLTTVQAQDDTIVYGKVGTSGAEVVKALLGKKVLDAGRQGKYFWYYTNVPFSVMEYQQIVTDIA